jgi:SAM-dependent methyltransferase
MESVACNLCGDRDPRVVYKKPDAKYFMDEVFSIVECRRCGLGYVNPRPTFAEMSRYYPAHFYQYLDDAPSYHAQRYRLQSLYLKPLSYATFRPRLLDIGCANGDFPRFMMKEGWVAEGVEVSSNSRAITDFPVYRVPFPDIPRREPYYDAITAWAVLEHVHDPMAYFAKSAQLLKRGGYLVFLVTNFNSISSRHLFLEDVPRHLYFYNEAVIKQYLQKNGLEFLRADYSNRIYEMRPTNWLYYYLARLKGDDLKFESLPEPQHKFFARQHLTGGLSASLSYVRYLLTSHPLAVIDRLLMPAIERLQIWTRRYGIVTFVARKP